MPALRFLALATLAFILPAGAFLWHQQLARLEREATRVLTGPELALAPGAELVWTLDLGASTEDAAWMDCQGQPALHVPLPRGATVGVRARYLARGVLPERDAWVAPAEGARVVREGADTPATFGPLWLSYLQPLELTFAVVAAPPGGGTARPVLAGEVSPDYTFARDLDRTVFTVFVVVGAAGVALFALVERHRTFRAPADRRGST